MMKYGFCQLKNCGVYWSFTSTSRRRNEQHRRARQQVAAHQARKAKGRALHLAARRLKLAKRARDDFRRGFPAIARQWSVPYWPALLARRGS